MSPSSDDFKTLLRKRLDFWLWFRSGVESSPGYSAMLTVPAYFYVMMSTVLPVWYKGPLKDISTLAMLPLISLLVGLSIGWVTNALNMSTSPEILMLSRKRVGGYIEYINRFHLALITILTSLIFWFIGATGFLDVLNDLGQAMHFSLCFCLYLSSFLSIQACMGLMSAQRDFMIARLEILMRMDSKRQKEEQASKVRLKDELQRAEQQAALEEIEKERRAQLQLEKENQKIL